MSKILLVASQICFKDKREIFFSFHNNTGENSMHFHMFETLKKTQIVPDKLDVMLQKLIGRIEFF